VARAVAGSGVGRACLAAGTRRLRLRPYLQPYGYGRSSPAPPDAGHGGRRRPGAATGGTAGGSECSEVSAQAVCQWRCAVAAARPWPQLRAAEEGPARRTPDLQPACSSRTVNMGQLRLETRMRAGCCHGRRAAVRARQPARRAALRTARRAAKLPTARWRRPSTTVAAAAIADGAGCARRLAPPGWPRPAGPPCWRWPVRAASTDAQAATRHRPTMSFSGHSSAARRRQGLQAAECAVAPCPHTTIAYLQLPTHPAPPLPTPRPPGQGTSRWGTSRCAQPAGATAGNC
jgi:hypothetical protein